MEPAASAPGAPLGGRAWRWAAWSLFVALIVAARWFHQPWRDEAEAWAVSRDASLAELIPYFSHTGHPPLWYLVQIPFAKLGLPLETQGVLNLAFAAAVAWLVLFRSPLHATTSIPLLFSVHLAHEYAVVARGYMLMVLVLFGVAALHPSRLERPVRYATALGLLFLTEIFVWPVAGLLTLFFARDLVVARAPRSALAVVAVGGLVALVLVWPRADRSGETAGTHLEPLAAVVALREGFLPLGSFLYTLEPWLGRLSLRVPAVSPPLLPAVVVLGLSAVALRRRPRAGLVLAAWVAWLAFIFACKYRGSFWHHGLAVPFLIATLWLARAEEARDRATLAAERLLGWALPVTLVLSVAIGAFVALHDARSPYSGGPDAARFLATQPTPIIAIGGRAVSAVAARLPSGAVWLAAERRPGSFLHWGAEEAALRARPHVDMLADGLALEPARKTTIVLSDAEFADPARRGLVELHRSPGMREGFWIYRFDR